MNSCLYVGGVVHQRFRPVPHRFRYRVCQLYVDLDELPSLFDPFWLWSARKPALAWFRRSDYLGDPDIALADAVRALVAEHTSEAPIGPVHLLTYPRYFGYVCNPVSFYFCFDPSGTHVRFIVAEITNTPWGECHSYVLRCEGPGPWTFEFQKGFHISPFMPMEQSYRWHLDTPGSELSVRMESLEAGERVFGAALTLRRDPITGASLARALTHFPWMTAKVVGAIYFEALRLKLKGVAFHEHPGRRDETAVVRAKEGI